MKYTRLSHSRQLLLNILWFPLNAIIAALLAIVIPTQLLLFVPSSQVGSVMQATILSGLVVAGSIISLLLPPLIGALSDRTPGRLGRRRPYLLIGGLLLAGSTPLLVNAETLVLFFTGLALLHVGVNIVNPAYQSLVPDLVPKEQRGAASGYVGGLTILGSMASLGLAAWLLGGVSLHMFHADLVRRNAGIYYMVTVTLMTIGILITVLTAHEVPYSHHDSHPTPEATERKRTIPSLVWRLMHHWVEPWHERNFTIVFLARMAIMLGMTMFMTYVEYYFASVQHITNFVATTAIITLLALGGGVVSGILAGVLSDRIKRRAPVVSVATLFMSLTAFGFVIIPDHFEIWLWPLGIVFGLGYGAFSSVDWALTIDTLPSFKELGKHLGLWNASTTLPALIAPLLGGFIITTVGGQKDIELGYRLIFACATFFLLVATFGILLVRERHPLS
ncbi:MAG TPA: MFS transporter [Ktedonobacteraceae bacterium]|nr:MFS transporter [Ktedonobacteraceae bacterium]